MSNTLYRFVKATPDNFPKEKRNYFLRHPYEDGRWHGWWSYIVPEAIDKDVWLNLGYEWLEEVKEADQQELWETINDIRDDQSPYFALKHIKESYTLIPKQ